ncbi:hypothetical protein B566_EDAN007954 [Ephemera danica]|nr:hypothetical protein B566_EDAN007954 [Ephemera danica]
MHLIIFSALIIKVTVAIDYVPVVLWESGPLEPPTHLPALKKIEGETFRNSILNNVHKDLILVFAEENLSIEDFAWRNEAGIGSFTKLDNLTSELSLASQFYPSVEDPIETLLENQEWEHLPITADLPQILTTKKHSPFVFVHLNDAADSEDRPHMLHRHDAIIADAFHAARQVYNSVIVVYSGFHSSWAPAQENIRRVRSLLAMEETADNSTQFINANGSVYMYTSSSPVFKTPDGSFNLTKFVSVSVEETQIRRGLIMKVEYDVEGKMLTVTYEFPETPAGYWSLLNVTVTHESANATMSANGVTAPYGFSYHCSNDTIYSNEMYSLILKDFQVEALPPRPESEQFSNAYDCVYFFTIPILSGLMVTILLIFIMSIGLTMLMDIKTMDRFDDPKGKTITINATD